MKRFIFLIAAIIASLTILAQSSDYINYQAVVRDANGNVKVNTGVTIAIAIIQGSTSGITVFTETHTTQTNAFGLVTLMIGSENSTDFSAIDWTNAPYFIRISVDGTVMGTSQLLSVPYALHAKNAENYTETDPVFLAHPANGISAGNISNWNTAYGWGNHAGLYRSASWLPSWSDVTSKPTTISGYGIEDFDFSGAITNDLLRFNGTKWVKFTPNYITSFTELDPAVTSNFDFTGATNNDLLQFNGTKWVKFTPNFLTSEVDGSATNEIQTLSLSTNQLTISGTVGNTVTFTDWDTNAADDVTIPTSPTTGDMLYYNGTNWTGVPKGTNGQVLTMNASGVPEWQNSITAPSATTNAATFNVATTPITAILNGVVNPNKLPTTVTFQYGTTTSYGSTATAAQSPVNGSSNTNVSCDLSSLTPGTTYHFRVKAENALGIAYGDDMSFTLLGLGISWAGGLIFYIDNTGQHGLVCAPSDQSTGIQWYNGSDVITGATATATGTGQANTTTIVTIQGAGNYAAQLCDDLDLNGHTDWFLPSIDELGLMYTKLKLFGLGSFSSVNYWCSSEYDISNSRKQQFGDSSQGTATKDMLYYVRAARAF